MTTIFINSLQTIITPIPFTWKRNNIISARELFIFIVFIIVYTFIFYLTFTSITPKNITFNFFIITPISAKHRMSTTISSKSTTFPTFIPYFFSDNVFWISCIIIVNTIHNTIHYILKKISLHEYIFTSIILLINHLIPLSIFIL